METKAEILAWLRGQIAERQAAQDKRSEDEPFRAGWHDGWKLALQWVADELDSEDLPCS